MTIFRLTNILKMRRYLKSTYRSYLFQRGSRKVKKRTLRISCVAFPLMVNTVKMLLTLPIVAVTPNQALKDALVDQICKEIQTMSEMSCKLSHLACRQTIRPTMKKQSLTTVLPENCAVSLS